MEKRIQISVLVMIVVRIGNAMYFPKVAASAETREECFGCLTGDYVICIEAKKFK